MAEVKFLNTYKDVFNPEAVEFYAIVDGKQVPCRITPDEIDREFHCHDSNYVADFLALRPQIEERAKRMLLEKMDGSPPNRQG